MFGLYRYLLAVVVLISHLGDVGIIGWLGVHGFFILSGYLMTLILHRNYGYHRAGILGFLINRALRLYPIYWCVLVISCFILMVAGGTGSTTFFSKLTLPNTVGGWAANISLIYPQWFPSRMEAVISPPSWTLTVEWLFYILMALGLSRSWKRTSLWIGVALSYSIFTHIAGFGLEWRYATLAAGALPFAIGAGLFHVETLIEKNRRFIEGNAITSWLCGLLTLNGVICILAHAEALTVLTDVTFYLNMILNAGLIANLSLKKRPIGQSILQRLDRVAGDLSYPIYLLHLPVAFGVSYFTFGRSERIYDSSTLMLMGVTLIVSSALGLILNKYPDSYIRKLRGRFRRTKQVTT